MKGFREREEEREREREREREKYSCYDATALSDISIIIKSNVKSKFLSLRRYYLLPTSQIIFGNWGSAGGCAFSRISIQLALPFINVRQFVESPFTATQRAERLDCGKANFQFTVSEPHR